jgi:cob(I)alamin adenosyltransferase
MAQPVIIVFTGDGKGKTEAALGLLLRALGFGFKVTFIQFIKAWETSEDKTLAKLQQIYPDQLHIHKGGKGFYYGETHKKTEVTDTEHKRAAKDSYAYVYESAISGKYDLVIADEINNAVHDGLLAKAQLKKLITSTKSHLCLTGRNFPSDLVPLTSITTDMQKQKHHFDEGIFAIPGLDL